MGIQHAFLNLDLSQSIVEKTGFLLYRNITKTKFGVKFASVMHRAQISLSFELLYYICIMYIFEKETVMENFFSRIRLVLTSSLIMTVISCESNKEPEVITTPVSHITHTTARTGGTIIYDNKSEITARGVCWSKESGPNLDHLYTSDGKGNGIFESTINGLTSETVYYVRSYASSIEGTTYGNEVSFKTLADGESSQIIADHNVVDRFSEIPQLYIDKVKEMWLVYAGESHSKALRDGLTLLAEQHSKYTVSSIESGDPEPFTAENLRVSRATWGDISTSSGWVYSYGEEDWFTSSDAIARTKAGITYCNTHDREISVIGFGWCWDDEMKAEDIMDYLNATQEYINYCNSKSYATKVIFTTTPVDGSHYVKKELGWQNHLQHEHIRSFVAEDHSRILFDYADILCYDDGSTEPATSTWNGNVYPIITTANGIPEETGHITKSGAIRLAKAMWWMLARIAGWEEVS